MGFFICPMDDALALVSLDLSGRPYLKFKASFRARRVGDLNIDLIEDFFCALSSALAANIHVQVLTGRSDHHKVEAIFKALAKALGQACAVNRASRRRIPSTKGLL
jgi:imidazoleglycerol-phosphate dehydratase